MDDLHNCAMYCANGLICDYFDAGHKPTIKELRGNWNSHSYEIITDDELQEIIYKVERFYKYKS